MLVVQSHFMGSSKPFMCGMPPSMLIFWTLDIFDVSLTQIFILYSLAYFLLSLGYMLTILLLFQTIYHTWRILKLFWHKSLLWPKMSTLNIVWVFKSNKIKLTKSFFFCKRNIFMIFCISFTWKLVNPLPFYWVEIYCCWS